MTISVKLHLSTTLSSSTISYTCFITFSSSLFSSINPSCFWCVSKLQTSVHFPLNTLVGHLFLSSFVAVMFCVRCSLTSTLGEFSTVSCLPLSSCGLFILFACFLFFIYFFDLIISIAIIWFLLISIWRLPLHFNMVWEISPCFALLLLFFLNFNFY